MRSRIIVGSLLVLGVLTAGTIATTGNGVAPTRQWAIANFVNPVLVDNQLLMGKYLIVHDYARMARGAACTSFYRFDAVKGPQEEVVSFHCTPVHRNIVNRLKLTQSAPIDGVGIPRVTEFQFEGDCEGHAIPTRR
jgi:hypothetical protein